MDYFKKIKSDITDVQLMSFQERVEKSTALKEKYPHCVPVIMNKSKNIVQDNIQTKYLVPKNVEMSYLLASIRKRLKLEPSKALFLFIQKDNNSFLMTPSTLVGEVYNLHASEDGFVYLVYTLENTFG